MYVYAACACRTFSGSSLPSVHYPIFCPLTSLFFRPVCLSDLRSHIRPPLGLLECFLLRRFVIHHPPPQSIYIHARLSVHVLYSRHHATKVPTTPASDDLDLCFPDDAGGDPVEPRGSANRHTARDVTGSAESIPRARTKFPEPINDPLHEALSFRRDSRQDLVMGM